MYSIGYAFPGSKRAKICGAADAGGYVVYRVKSLRSDRHLANPVLATHTAFADIMGAYRWIRETEQALVNEAE